MARRALSIMKLLALCDRAAPAGSPTHQWQPRTRSLLARQCLTQAVRHDLSACDEAIEKGIAVTRVYMDLPADIAHPARCFHHPTLNTVVVVTKTRRNILQCLTAGRLNIADTVYCSALRHRRLSHSSARECETSPAYIR